MVNLWYRDLSTEHKKFVVRAYRSSENKGQVKRLFEQEFGDGISESALETVLKEGKVKINSAPGGRNNTLSDDYARQTYAEFNGDPNLASKRGCYNEPSTYAKAWKRLGLDVIVQPIPIQKKRKPRMFVRTGRVLR